MSCKRTDKGAVHMPRFLCSQIHCFQCRRVAGALKCQSNARTVHTHSQQPIFQATMAAPRDKQFNFWNMCKGPTNPSWPISFPFSINISLINMENLIIKCRAARALHLSHGRYALTLIKVNNLRRYSTCWGCLSTSGATCRHVLESWLKNGTKVGPSTRPFSSKQWMTQHLYGP